MVRSILLLILPVLTLNTLMAQGGPVSGKEDLLRFLQEEGPRDRVNIEVDSLLVANYNKLITRNMQTTGIPGYRIRIFSESGLGAKQAQQQVRARFLSLYPGLDAYNEYDEPFFKVYVGDCRTKSEALKLQDRIRKDFPNSIIREDYIQLKHGD
jgi:hypothetical protein